MMTPKDLAGMFKKVFFVILFFVFSISQANAAEVIADMVSETTSTTGTGTLSLSGARTGYRTFVSAIGTGNTCPYQIKGSGGEWEIGLGTVTDATPDTLSRDTVYSSSNAGAKVDFSTGIKTVTVVMPADGMADMRTYAANMVYGANYYGATKETKNIDGVNLTTWASGYLYPREVNSYQFAGEGALAPLIPVTATTPATYATDTTTTTGTGVISLVGTDMVTVFGNGGTCDYKISIGSEWEVGSGTITDGTPDTLTRNAVYASTNNNTFVNFPAGTKTVAAGEVFFPPGFGCFLFGKIDEDDSPWTSAEGTSEYAIPQVQTDLLHVRLVTNNSDDIGSKVGAVAFGPRAYIYSSGGNGVGDPTASGRVWAMNPFVVIDSQSDGQVTGCEINLDLLNPAGVQPTSPFMYKSKIGYSAIMKSTCAIDATVAYAIMDGTSASGIGWNFGFWAEEDAIETGFLSLKNRCIVDENGYAVFGDDDDSDDADQAILDNVCAKKTNAEPTIALRREDFTPTAGDSIGKILFYGMDSATVEADYADSYDTYGCILAKAVDATSGSEDGSITMSVKRAGSLTDTMVFDASTYPTLTLRRGDTSGSYPEGAGKLAFAGRDSIGTDTNYANITTNISDATDGSEDGSLLFGTKVAGGAIATQMTVANGVVIGSPTGSFQGAGTLNAVAVYDDGSALTDYVLDAWIDGRIDMDFYDSTRVDGEHVPANNFSENMDELDPEKYSAKWHSTHKLPAFDRLEQRQAAGEKLGIGASIQALIETCEVQAVHIRQLTQKIKAMEDRGL